MSFNPDANYIASKIQLKFAKEDWKAEIEKIQPQEMQDAVRAFLRIAWARIGVANKANARVMARKANGTFYR